MLVIIKTEQIMTSWNAECMYTSIFEGSNILEDMSIKLIFLNYQFSNSKHINIMKIFIPGIIL